MELEQVLVQVLLLAILEQQRPEQLELEQQQLERVRLVVQALPLVEEEEASSLVLS
jgi:hypothetical protein